MSNNLLALFMERILNFANNELHRSFDFDGCEKLLDDWNGSEIYAVTSSTSKHLCIGMPVLIRDTNGILEEVASPKEIFEIMKASGNS